MRLEELASTREALARLLYRQAHTHDPAAAVHRWDFQPHLVADAQVFRGRAAELVAAVPATTLHPIIAGPEPEERAGGVVRPALPAAGGAWLHATCSRVTFTPEADPPEVCRHPGCTMRTERWVRLYAERPTAVERRRR
jgi:hypothetical protein